MHKKQAKLEYKHYYYWRKNSKKLYKKLVIVRLQKVQEFKANKRKQVLTRTYKIEKKPLTQAHE